MSEWFYAVGGVQYGPVPEEVLRGYVAEGRVSGGDVVWRDGMTEWVEVQRISALAPARTAPFFAIGIAKLVIMTLLTFGLYEIYWFYRHWRIVKERTDQDIWPLPRAVFGVFFFHALMAEVEDYAREKQLMLAFQKSGLAVLFFLLNISYRLPDPFWLLGFATLVPLIIVQRQINALHAAVTPYAERNESIRGWNWLAVALGIPFWALVILGLFMP